MSMSDVLNLQTVEIDFYAGLEVREGTSSDSGTCSCKSTIFCFE